MSKLLAVGTVAFDAIETPFGKTDKILGGSGAYIGLVSYPVWSRILELFL